MILTNNTIQAEDLGDFFKNLRKKGFNVSKMLAKHVLKNPSRALDVTPNIATAAASRNPKNVMKSPPELMTFYTLESVFILVMLFKLYYKKEQKWNKRLYPSAQLENIVLQQRLEKKLKDVNSFNYHISNMKEKITYFKDKNNKPEKKKNIKH